MPPIQPTNMQLAIGVVVAIVLLFFMVWCMPLPNEQERPEDECEALEQDISARLFLRGYAVGSVRVEPVHEEDRASFIAHVRLVARHEYTPHYWE